MNIRERYAAEWATLIELRQQHDALEKQAERAEQERQAKWADVIRQVSICTALESDLEKEKKPAELHFALSIISNN